MKRLNWKIALGMSLVVLSAALYVIHFFIFRDAHHIFLYLLGDIAFLPIEVLLVTLVIHQILTEREKRIMLKKLNMVIGAFFSEVGTKLLREFVAIDRAGAPKCEMLGAGAWRDRDIKGLVKYFGACEYSAVPSAADLARLREALAKERGFLLALLENPNLLEHESFTNMLWAVFHLDEELEAREKFASLPGSDLKHIEGDIKRAYTALAVEWLYYMEHLRGNYPYLFSLAVRTNPFDRSASVVVTE